MFKDVDIVCVFLRNRIFVQQIFLRNRRFRLRQKYPLANFRVELFSCLAREHSWQISPSIYSTRSSIKTWTVPHIAFARDVTVTVGRWLVVNHKHEDYASTALTLVNVTNTTRLLGGDE